jgi:anti-repressor protein
MNELIKIEVNENKEQIVSCRDLFEKLECKERFSKWFDRMIGYGFEENVDYTLYQKVHPQNKQTIDDYAIKISMAKEICMLQRSEIGKQFRQYFIECEKQVLQTNTKDKLLLQLFSNDPMQVATAHKELVALETKPLKETIAIQAPKAEFYDDVVDSKDAIDMGKVAKTLNIDGIGRNKLFEILRNKKILQSNNIPYQQYIDRRYFRCVESKYMKSNGDICVNIKTVVFQKGLDYIRKVIKDFNK